MINISRYSRTMYVVRGSTGVYKDKLKSYGMKWTRKLKGGPGYIFRIRSKNDITLLKAIKDFVFDMNKKEQNDTDYELVTVTINRSNKRKRSEMNSYQPAKKTKSYHAPFEPVYDVKDDMFLVFPIMVLSWIVLIVSIYEVLNVFYGKTNGYSVCTEYNTLFEKAVGSIYDYVSSFEYSKLNFTVIYPVISFPHIDEYRYDYYLTY